jgi:predicted enzyme related to lactoylglutathione lyase
MDKNVNALNWFEIPVTDIARARKFYEAAFAIEMHDMGEMMGMKFVGFPAEMGNGKVSGAIAEGQMYAPSQNGIVIYLNANPSIKAVTDRIEPAGGKLVMPPMEISPEIGFMAFFVDTEGNKIGLHAQK